MPTRIGMRAYGIKIASLIGVVVTAASLLQSPAAAAPSATFDWSMPERFKDANADGVLDYFSDIPSESLRRAFISPPSWTVVLDACASSPAPDEYRWTVDGKTVKPEPTFIPCRFTQAFPREGVYDVGLTVVDGGVASPPVLQQVMVQDWLIVSLGDSYGSGEGAPDEEGITSSPVWKDARCDRSANAGSALAARRIEEEDPKTSVTFVHLACSGATVMSGLLGPYEGAQPPDDLDPEELGNPFPCLASPTPSGCLPPQVDRAAELIQGRELDALYLSIGGNDAHFADIVLACIVQDPCDQRPYDVIGDGPLEALRDACRFTLPDDPCDTFVDFLRSFRDRTARNAQELIDDGIDGGGASDPPAVFKGLRPLYDELNDALNTKLLNGGAWSNRVFQAEYVDATTSHLGGYCGSDTILSIFGHPPYVQTTESAWVDMNVERRLNSVIAENRGRYGWNVIDGIHRVFQKHGLCSNSPYLRSIGDSLLYQGDIKGAVHPNKTGYTVYGERAYGEFRRSFYGPCAPALEPGLHVLEGEFVETADADFTESYGDGVYAEESFRERFAGDFCKQFVFSNGVIQDAGDSYTLSHRFVRRDFQPNCESPVTDSWEISTPVTEPTAFDYPTGHVLVQGDPDGWQVFPYTGFDVFRSSGGCGAPTTTQTNTMATYSQCDPSDNVARLERETDEQRIFVLECSPEPFPNYGTRLVGQVIEWLDPPTESRTRVPALRAQIDSGPAEGAKVKTKKRTAKVRFAFSANQPATFSCRIDSNPYSPCSSPVTFKVKAGRHTFEVRATDDTGNHTTLSRRFKVVRRR